MIRLARVQRPLFRGCGSGALCMGTAEFQRRGSWGMPGVDLLVWLCRRAGVLPFARLLVGCTGSYTDRFLLGPAYRFSE